MQSIEKNEISEFRSSIFKLSTVLLSHPVRIGGWLVGLLVGWLVILFYGVSTLFELFNAELNFKQFSLAKVLSLNVKTVLYLVIHFSISRCFSSIWSIDLALPCTTIPGQSGPGSVGNKGGLCIPQSSSITKASASDSLVLNRGHTLGESNPSAEMHSVYSAAPANWATYWSV